MNLRLVALVVALCLAGCGGDDDEQPTAATTTVSSETSGCVAATSDMMAPLGGRVTLEGGRLGNGQMVQSEASPDYWFVAAELDGPGFEDEGDVATFVTTSQFGGEAIYSVDELAKAHTSLRDTEEAEVEAVDTDDPAAAQARACAGA